MTNKIAEGLRDAIETAKERNMDVTERLHLTLAEMAGKGSNLPPSAWNSHVLAVKEALHEIKRLRVLLRSSLSRTESLVEVIEDAVKLVEEYEVTLSRDNAQSQAMRIAAIEGRVDAATIEALMTDEDA
ncbi:MAG: hypothetical protein LPL29_13340 [Alphaproteobacteria bacterium]|nr:hypothetical protein [Alphaproteobacteria bacterium]